MVAGNRACGCCGMKIFAGRRARVFALYRSATESVRREIYHLTGCQPGCQPAPHLSPGHAGCDESPACADGTAQNESAIRCKRTTRGLAAEMHSSYRSYELKNSTRSILMFGKKVALWLVAGSRTCQRR